MSFPSEQPTQYTHISEFDAEVTIGDESFQCKGDAYYRYGAKHSICIELIIKNSSFKFLLNSVELCIKIPGKRKFKAISTLSKMNDFETKIIAVPSPQLVEPEIKGVLWLYSATAQLLNFRMEGSNKSGENYKLSENGRIKWIGSTYIKHEDWIIGIKGRENTEAIQKELSHNEGFNITHDIEIHKVNKKAFTVNQLIDLKSVFEKFISFADGNSVSIHNLIGYGKDGVNKYSPWSVTMCDSWQGRMSWFDVHNSQTLGEAFSGFYSVFKDPEMSEAIRKALYWYLRSNRSSSGIDGGIILSHSALERISNGVIEKYGISFPPNLQLTAAVKIRFAANYLGIPIILKKENGLIYKLKQRKVWTDMPDALNKYRNDLVHPKQKLSMHRSELVVPIWSLAQWLIEMFILKLSSFNGVYSNRLNTSRWKGAVEYVPWIKPSLIKKPQLKC